MRNEVPARERLAAKLDRAGTRFATGYHAEMPIIGWSLRDWQR
jgi:hypothetical protein